MRKIKSIVDIETIQVMAMYVRYNFCCWCTIFLDFSSHISALSSVCDQWRAPEEYYDKPLNEQIDIWSLGNNVSGVLLHHLFSL